MQTTLQTQCTSVSWLRRQFGPAVGAATPTAAQATVQDSPAGRAGGFCISGRGPKDSAVARRRENKTHLVMLRLAPSQVAAVDQLARSLGECRSVALRFAVMRGIETIAHGAAR